MAAGALVLLALYAFPASAQEPDTTAADTTRADTTRVTQLQTIEVTSSIAPTAGPVIGSGIPARISTTGEAIDAREPRLLADALATQPGISLYDDLGSPFKLNLSTRGFNVGPGGRPASRHLGLPRRCAPERADAAEVNFDLLPMEHGSRVELLAGSLLGPNSLGGAVNLITRRERAPSWRRPRSPVATTGLTRRGVRWRRERGWVGLLLGGRL